MIVIIGAIKDILLQISAASSFLVLFQWWLDQRQTNLRKEQFPDVQCFLTIACALSLTLCSILSTTLFGIAYLNLGVLPAFIGILYANFRSGISLSIFLLICNLLFSQPAGLSNLLLNSGILLFPLLFGLSGPFKKGTLIEKIGMLWMVLFPNMLFIALVPILGGRDIYESNSSQALLLTLYLFITVALGGLFIYFIETAHKRFRYKERIIGISDKFRQESEKLQQITNIVPLSILTLDDQGRITGLNEYMLEMIRTQYPNVRKEDILSQHVGRFFNDSLTDPKFQKMRENVCNNKRYSEKIIHESRIYHIYTAPLQRVEPDSLKGSVLIIQDTTEEDKIRTELKNVERLTLVGQMAAGITHEIRNPMAVVRGFLQLMREKSSQELDSYYQIVMEELDRANSIITDFLSLAQTRISDKEPVLLHHIIEEISPLLWADANLRGQSVELKLAPSLPLLLLNVREIKQVILNLGRNGMEAMGSKGTLTLETRSMYDRVELIVRDTGSGIPKSQLDQLFVPFFTTKSQGTGLGLSLCLSIVERHNGKITVDSQEGEGTAFTITFPCKAEENMGFAAAE